MRQHKKTLRAHLKASRRNMTVAEVEALSKKIAGQTLGLIDWAAVHSLHTYLPLPEQCEADTRILLDALWRKYPQIKTATWQNPRDAAGSVWIQRGGTEEAVSPPQQFDVIIVPLLGFNDACHRIGFGGGFYDRFLPTQPNAITIGFCYEAGRVSFQPEPHDIPLTHIVTEDRII